MHAQKQSKMVKFGSYGTVNVKICNYLQRLWLTNINNWILLVFLSILGLKCFLAK